MAIKKVRTHGSAFTVLVGHHQYAADPSSDSPLYPPPVVRQAVTYQHVGTHTDGSVNSTNVVALIAGSPKVSKTASFVVDDNDFSTGSTVILLGDFELRSGIDYVVGASTALTATNIAAAIDNLAGFSAAPAGSTVDVEYDTSPASAVDFTVTHLGTIENFITLTPDTGVMANGAPGVSAPALT